MHLFLISILKTDVDTFDCCKLIKIEIILIDQVVKKVKNNSKTLIVLLFDNQIFMKCLQTNGQFRQLFL